MTSQTMTSQRIVPVPVPVATLVPLPIRRVAVRFGNALGGFSRKRRERRQFQQTLKTYRGLEGQMLEDIGLSTAVIEGALAGEDRAIEAFRDWSRRHRRI